MNVGFQITDGCTPRRGTTLWPGWHGGRTAEWPVRCRVRSIKLKAVPDIISKQYKVPHTHYTAGPALGSVAHHPYTAAPALGSVAHDPYTNTIAHIGDTRILGCALKPGLSADSRLASLWVRSHPAGSEVK